jgi:hypothetical protein
MDRHDPLQDDFKLSDLALGLHHECLQVRALGSGGGLGRSSDLGAFMEMSEQSSIRYDLNFLKPTSIIFSQSFDGLFNSLFGTAIVRKVKINQ